MSRITENIFKVACFLIVTLMVCVMPLSAKNKFTVVIDPGHGGKDTGAVADDKKTLEKDINLQVALKLGDILKKKKGFKVVYTRNSDKFVGLNDRADKANKEKADIFISIHTNSLDANNASRKTAEGAQVYVLGLHRDADNLAVARRENSVIVKEKNFEETYENFDPDKDESYIIFEMAQKKNLSNSIGLAQDIEKELVKAGRKDRGVHQAGFLVLRETAMPSVLVELDFICNPNSAKYMSTSAGQKKLATAIANAVVTYRNNIEKRGDKAYHGASLDGSEEGDVYVLTSLKSVERKDHVPSERNARKAGERRRRSVAAARQSSQRDLSTDNIIAHKEYTGVSVNSNDNPFYSEEPPEEKRIADNSASVKKEKKSNKKNKKDDKKNKEKASDEVVTRINGGKKVVVKNVQPGSSSVVSLKSSKDRKEKRADSARFVADTPAEDVTVSGKGMKLVDKKQAASRAAEKEQADADKKSGKSLKSKKADDEKKLRQQEEKARKAEEKRLAEEKKQQKKIADAKSAKKSAAKPAKKESKSSEKETASDRYEEVKQKAAESKTVPAVKSLKRKKHNR